MDTINKLLSLVEPRMQTRDIRGWRQQVLLARDMLMIIPAAPIFDDTSDWGIGSLDHCDAAVPLEAGDDSMPSVKPSQPTLHHRRLTWTIPCEQCFAPDLSVPDGCADYHICFEFFGVDFLDLCHEDPLPDLISISQL
jgi:hypothetical protein